MAAIRPLRRRMIEDMTIRNLSPATSDPISTRSRSSAGISAGRRIASAWTRSMLSEDELLGCVDWIAHGFEIVHSIFPHWTFTAADAVAAYGVHGALLLGGKHSISDRRGEWATALSSFTVDLVRDDGISRRGHATHVCWAGL